MPDAAAVPGPPQDINALLSGLSEGVGGAVWRLAEDARQLDANVVRLPGGRRVDTHAEPDLDVLFLVLSGAGTLESGERCEPLAQGVLIWLPHGSSRSLTAGPQGLCYLTVHRRRPGMRIGERPAGKPSAGV